MSVCVCVCFYMYACVYACLYIHVMSVCMHVCVNTKLMYWALLLQPLLSQLATLNLYMYMYVDPLGGDNDIQQLLSVGVYS